MLQPAGVVMVLILPLLLMLLLLLLLMLLQLLLAAAAAAGLCTSESVSATEANSVPFVKSNRLPTVQFYITKMLYYFYQNQFISNK